MLTDLGSTNGTWLNRAQLRPHRDTQIRAGNTVAFGDSSIAFRLVALEPDNIPTALRLAAGVLEGSRSDAALAEEYNLQSAEVAESGVMERHKELICLAQSLGIDGTIWLQVIPTRCLPSLLLKVCYFCLGALRCMI